MVMVACMLNWDNFDIRRGGELPCLDGLPLQSLAEPGGCVPLPDGVVAVGGEGKGASIPSISRFRLAPSWSDWLRSNAAALVDNMDVGEWVCHRAMLRNVDDELECPIRGIRFSKRQSPQYPDRVLLEGEGIDVIDWRRHFRGWASRSSGRVVLSMALQVPGEAPSNPLPWIHDGVMTPVGVAGRWPGMMDNGAVGCIWMYRKDWERPPAVGESSSRPWCQYPRGFSTKCQTDAEIYPPRGPWICTTYSELLLGLP